MARESWISLVRGIIRVRARRTQTSHALVSSIVVRGVGLVAFFAFASLRRQVLGLFGQGGIVPIEQRLQHLRDSRLGPRYQAVPTLLWLGASDRALLRLCRLGELCALALAAQVAPRLAALGVWALYLSVVSAGSPFLSFQWDALLIESALIAGMVAPPHFLQLSKAYEPRPEVFFLLRLLVFRLYFESGLAKFQSGDAAWRNLFACTYHYETQPLPTPLAWYAHQLPTWFQRVSTAAVLAIELVVPILALAPGRVRRFAFLPLAGLQVLIALTGNYAFFNLLTIVLSFSLLDDRTVCAVLRRNRQFLTSRIHERALHSWSSRALGVLSIGLASLSLLELVQGMFPSWSRRRIPQTILRTQGKLMPFYSVNSYGLFAVMTRTRPEIIIQGSNDGKDFRNYELPFKPGALNVRPRWALPHQPRLDWQLWFAAMQDPPEWFVTLLLRLLEGARDVEALFAKVPFATRPKYVRALLYEYRMTDRKLRAKTGNVWQRGSCEVYVPPLRLAAGEELAPVLETRAVEKRAR